MSDLDYVVSADLPSLVDHAASALANARTSAEVLQAKEMAGQVYDQAKRAGRLARAVNAHNDLQKAVRAAQGDAAEIEFAATARLAEEYEAAKDRGEVAGQGGDRGNQHVAKVPDRNAATSAELGISRKTIHEGRVILEAERSEPGIVRRAVDVLVDGGEEPSKAAIGRAVAEAAGRRVSPPQPPKPTPGESYTRFIKLAVEMGKLDPTDIVAGIPDASRRAGLMSHVRGLTDRLEKVDEIMGEGVSHA